MEFACKGEAFADKNSHYSSILTANASPLRHIAIFILVKVGWVEERNPTFNF
jgi:hypothetical protein